MDPLPPELNLLQEDLSRRRNQETLKSIVENDDTLTTLTIGNYARKGGCIPCSQDYFSGIGTALGDNSNIKSLDIDLGMAERMQTFDSTLFVEGLKRNSSIRHLTIGGDDRNIAGGFIQKVLDNINNDLITLSISGSRLIDETSTTLQGGGDRIVANTLRRCRNLKSLELSFCGVNNELLLPIIEAARGHRLEKLEISLNDGSFGNTECKSLATTLLEDPNSNLQTLVLKFNQIGTEGAISIANGLSNNNKLKELNLSFNFGIHESVCSPIFSNLLCNKSTINDTYSSNHTLQKLSISGSEQLLKLNEGLNKRHVAIKKILLCHSDIDMKPLYGWDKEDEKSLKSLPHVVDWFGRVKAATGEKGSGIVEDTSPRKLSAIFQFARDMPLMFVPIPQIAGGGKKRKINHL